MPKSVDRAEALNLHYHICNGVASCNGMGLTITTTTPYINNSLDLYAHVPIICNVNIANNKIFVINLSEGLHKMSMRRAFVATSPISPT